MSADNGVYIHKFRNGWKVCHAQAIENINYDPDKSGYNKKVLYEYFKWSPVFKSKDAAWKYAQDLYSRIDIVEYGICEV